MKKRAIVSVINDLVTDQRVKKTCQTLTDLGFEVTLTGRKMRSGPPMDDRPYKTVRMKLVAEKGPLFYACFNFRLFFFLLSRKSELLVANDLDTLLPNYLVSRMKNIPLVYDSHEYFTGVPELVNRKKVQGVWKSIEKRIFPKLKTVITVNDSIAGLYEKEYGVRPFVVRNISPSGTPPEIINRTSLGLPEDKFILILQGSGINVQRGAEEMVLAMNYIQKAVLLIVGGGDVVGKLKEMVKDNKLEDRVIFRPRQPHDELYKLTCAADLGLTLDKDTNINYRYSLPNKLFDYIQARIPVLASPLPEIKKIVEKYDIGDFIAGHEPATIAEKVNEILANQELMSKWKKNVNFAASELTWANEEQVLKNIFKEYA
ncbi:MAG: glycosyltransferase family 4 protein [Chlorobi bacterium]|nr:glycosyltransferase family 4 protein [Chlorobiota bacterium]